MFIHAVNVYGHGVNDCTNMKFHLINEFFRLIGHFLKKINCFFVIKQFRRKF